MSCDPQVIVSGCTCSVVEVCCPGPQGPPGPAGSGTFVQSTIVASLPTPVVGLRALVTDATTTAFASLVAGGGSNTVPVYSDGSAWRIG